MKIYSAVFAERLFAAQQEGLAPRYFGWFKARNRETGAIEGFGLWSGEKNVSLNVPLASGGFASRLFVGSCGFQIRELQYVSNLTDNPVNVSMSQLSPVTQQLVRGYEVRLAEVELYASVRNGGVPVSPQMVWVGIVDEVMVATPEVGGSGNIGFSIRSELMHQLTKTNPTKSSDEHQKRRQADDEFCKYAGVIKSRQLDWYKPKGD